MKYYGKAEETAEVILEAFNNPSALPKALAPIFIRRNDGAPCRKWSWRNQLIVALNGHSDARGFRQWKGVGRSVIKGEKAFQILAPVTKKVKNEDNEESVVIVGYRSTSVFGFEQTEGEPLPSVSTDTEKEWIESLPLVEVATAWGLSVDTYEGRCGQALGVFTLGRGIALGVENLSTWAHEMVHAADHKNGTLKVYGGRIAPEIVAEFGGAILLTVLGRDADADLGGCYEYLTAYARKADVDVVSACGALLDRSCRAVAAILDAAEHIGAIRSGSAAT